MTPQKGLPELAEILRESLGNGRQPLLTVTSNSMSPLLRQGDQIILTHTPVSHLKPGDIISVENNQYILTHRYWYEENKKIITRGDRPLIFDPPHSKSNYIGRAICRKRGRAYLSIEDGPGDWLNNHLFLLAKLENKLFVSLKDPGFPQTTHIKWWQKQFHRILYLWGRFLTFIIGIFPRKTEQ